MKATAIHLFMSPYMTTVANVIDKPPKVATRKNIVGLHVKKYDKYLAFSLIIIPNFNVNISV